MDGSPNGSNVTDDGGIPYDCSAPEKSQYSVRPPTLSGDYTQFEWRKSRCILISLILMMSYGISLKIALTLKLMV